MRLTQAPPNWLERPPRRIAVLRANGLGDFLEATPALRALGRAFPRAEVTYLCRPGMAGFIQGRYPYIHRVVAIPYYPVLNDPPPGQALDEAAAREFFQAMRARRLDLAIQMQGGGRESNPFASRLGARHSLGLAARGVLPLETNVRYVYYQSEVLRYLELVSTIGVSSDGHQMDLPLLPADYAELAAAWNPDPSREYVVLHPGASEIRRCWPPERFARVAELVHDRFGLDVVIGGNESERGLAKIVQSLAGVPTTNLAGRMGMGAYAALLGGARLFVGNDTGPSHMAYALGRPSVVVYWCGNLINAGPPTRQIFRPVLSWTVNMPGLWEADHGPVVSATQLVRLPGVVRSGRAAWRGTRPRRGLARGADPRSRRAECVLKEREPGRRGRPRPGQEIAAGRGYPSTPDSLPIESRWSACSGSTPRPLIRKRHRTAAYDEAGWPTGRLLSATAPSARTSR